MFGMMVTERLQLNTIVQSDAVRIAELLADDLETIQMTEDLPDPCTPESAKDWVRARRRPGENVFAIQVNEDRCVDRMCRHQTRRSCGSSRILDWSCLLEHWLRYRGGMVGCKEREKLGGYQSL